MLGAGGILSAAVPVAVVTGTIVAGKLMSVWVAVRCINLVNMIGSTNPVRTGKTKLTPTKYTTLAVPKYLDVVADASARWQAKGFAV